MEFAAIPKRTVFGQKLRHELDSRRLSIRKFSRMLDADRPDAARRNIARWIGGYNQPSRIHRIAVAEALGLPSETFLSDDDEEADPVVALVSALHRVVRDAMKEKT